MTALPPTDDVGSNDESRRVVLDELVDLEMQFVAVAMPHHMSLMGALDLTPQQAGCLLLLANWGHLPISQVAHFIGVRPNVATGVVRRLEDRGLLSRKEDPDDRRVRLLSLTDDGQSMVDHLVGRARRQRHEQFGVLDDDQLSQLRDIFRVLAAAAPTTLDPPS